MKQGKTIENDFRLSISRSLENTLNFENHTQFEKYESDNEKKRVPSTLNLCLHHNYIFDTIIPYLRNTSVLEPVTDKEREEYCRNPMKLSYDKYGVVDYWWILLAVNGFFNPYEFHDFYYLRIPTKSEIASIIDRELFNNNTYGIIPE
jgi:hypothetical protein